MQNQNSEQELLSVIDFILNRADEKKLEVISAALERRTKEIQNGIKGLSSINPEVMAKQMSDSINKSIQMSLDGMRNTVRNFATDILQREAPELSQEQLNLLIESWIPAQDSFDDSIKPLAKNGKVSGIPADVLYGMVIQFVSYSIGEMSEKENSDLKNSMGDWTKKYWEYFPVKLRQEIKSFINGEITSGEFRKKIKVLIS